MITYSSLTAFNIDFTSSEGYNEGVLNGQQSWDATNGVEVTNNNSINFANNSAQRATYGQTIDGGVDFLMGSMDFRFTSNSAGGVDLFNLVELGTPDLGPVGIIFMDYVVSSQKFFLRFRDHETLTSNNISTTNFFTKAQLGLDNDANSDELRMVWRLSPGATNIHWALRLDLLNKTTNTIINLAHSGSDPTYIKNNRVVRPEFHSSNRIVHAGIATLGGNNDLTVNSFEVIPEPSQISLFLGSVAFVYLAFRRRKK